MIEIALYRTGEGSIKGFRVEGHAGMAEKGHDIVCAAISVLTQTAVLGLNRHLGLYPKISRKDGFMVCMLSEMDLRKQEAVQAILETMTIGLGEIAGQFPDRVRMEDHRG